MAEITKRVRKRCAIYTRKSSEEGLDQEFNSLQAQREACEAFIASQKSHEGWQALHRQTMTTAGIPGGTHGPPCPDSSLLEDIARIGEVDIVVVYKIDRLTRSLFDFAKIVEVFDAHSVSFVSVTQAFNTTTSMGRLTLNVLLSFAQFEREVTGERIRDKIAASKKKGMWMGGFAPLGYDARDRKLVINEPEAESVRYIFRRYLELGSVYKLKAELDTKGVTSKRRTSAAGRASGGNAIAAGALYQMLQNPIYSGRIGHKRQIFEGEHEAIIEPELWETVQQSLAVKRHQRRSGEGAKESSLLAGLLFDSEGKRLTPSHAVKRGKRYRYYVSRRLITDPGISSAVAWRIPALELERFVLNQVYDLLADQSRIWTLLSSANLSNNSALSALRHASKLAQDLPRFERRTNFLRLFRKVVVYDDRLETELSVTELISQLLQGRRLRTDDHVNRSLELGKNTIVLTSACRPVRRGSEMRLVINGQSRNEYRPDPTLIAAVVKANEWWGELCAGNVRTIKEIAVRENSDERYVARILKLAFLAPDIAIAILDGRQRPDMTADMASRMPDLPCSWALQRQRLVGACRAAGS